MGVNFVISALLLGFFINRLAHVLRLQQLEVQRVRERALRDEGILAIATQAAGAAHELNTPLSTMRTLLPELRREHAGDAALAEDLALLEGQVDRCRTILREMVAFGKAQLSQEPERLSVAQFIHGCLERFQLLRPGSGADRGRWTQTLAPPCCARRRACATRCSTCSTMPPMPRPADHSHAVALRCIARRRLAAVERARSRPRFWRDRRARPLLGHSQKQTGLGIGLALAEATAERLDGELIARNTEHGAEVCLRLPLAVIAEKYARRRRASSQRFRQEWAPAATSRKHRHDRVAPRHHRASAAAGR